jgi:cystathionine beta-lyase/cystathionine gamma-synthase
MARFDEFSTGARGYLGTSTRAIHGGPGPDPSTGAILPSICQSTTYVQDAVGVHKGHTYSRASNPTVSALEEALGGLEDAPPSVCFGTGLAAETGLFLALLGAGDEVVVSNVCYGGTVRLFRELLDGLGIRAVFADASDPAAIAAAITPRTKLVFIETPGNPTLKLTDIAALAKVTRAAGVKLAVDNTFLTPVIQRPLDLGADISVYSTTKYIEGHNSTVGGALTTRDPALLERLRWVRKSIGSIQSPFEAWLTLRGLKTLPLRIKQHSQSALTVARWLQSHPRVRKVIYPGLRSFTQHELAQRQHNGAHGTLHGGIVSFEVDGGVEQAVCVLNNTRLCSLAENLGAVETLITHPATMTHPDVPKADREAVGLTDGLIRLSVGLEDPIDIIEDLDAALAAAFSTARTQAAALTQETVECLAK